MSEGRGPGETVSLTGPGPVVHPGKMAVPGGHPWAPGASSLPTFQHIPPAELCLGPDDLPSFSVSTGGALGIGPSSI